MRPLAFLLLLLGPSVARPQCPGWGPGFGPAAHGVGGDVYALAAFDEDGPGPVPPGLFAGGSFAMAGGAPAANVARWDGSAWSAVAGGTNAPVEHLVVHDPDGPGAIAPALYVGGDFTQAGGQPASRIARWDGTAWSAVGGGFSTNPRGLASFDPDGPGPAPALLCAAVNSGATATVRAFDGASWSALGTFTHTFQPWLSALAAYDLDGPGPQPPALFAGGRFTHVDGLASRNIARFDGAWETLGDGLGTDDTVLAIAGVDLDGSGPLTRALFAGGTFTVAGALPTSHVARWDGTLWSAVGPGVDNAIGALAAWDTDGPGPLPERLYAGGFFTSAGSNAAAHVALWDGNAWQSMGLGTNDLVQAFSGYDPDGPGPAPSTLFLGGGFTTAGGAPSARVAEWRGCHFPFASFCPGDNSLPSLCPCWNPGMAGHGCKHSDPFSIGARLSVSGGTQPDTVVFAASELLPATSCVLLQGSQAVMSGVLFGDGVRCVSGAIRRLTTFASGAGSAIYPGAGDAAVSTASAALGDVLGPGVTRFYQVVYRDPDASFCAPPQGGSWNVTNGVAIAW